MRLRLALLTALVKQAPRQMLGQTALIKLVFLLTAVCDVPMGYRFRMYTYGPFDPEVISDVDYAARLDSLLVEIELYPKGYRYLIKPGSAASDVMNRARSFLDEHQQNIDRVTETFACRTAGDLELLSTIVYLNQEHRMSSMDEIVRTVKDIKPRFTEESVRREAKRLRETDVAALSIPRSAAPRQLDFDERTPNG